MTFQLLFLFCEKLTLSNSSVLPANGDVWLKDIWTSDPTKFVIQSPYSDEYILFTVILFHFNLKPKINTSNLDMMSFRSQINFLANLHKNLSPFFSVFMSLVWWNQVIMLSQSDHHFDSILIIYFSALYDPNFVWMQSFYNRAEDPDWGSSRKACCW